MTADRFTVVLNNGTEIIFCKDVADAARIYTEVLMRLDVGRIAVLNTAGETILTRDVQSAGSHIEAMH